MFNSQREFLTRFGWDGFFESQIPTEASRNLVPARVISEEKSLYRIQVDLGEARWASVSGRHAFASSRREDFPAVGDWVMVDLPVQSDRAIIHHVLPRKTLLHRRQVGGGAENQILSTNVDYAFITTSANEDLNRRRIERYLAVAWDAGAVPIVLLTKADLIRDSISALIFDLEEEFRGVQIHAVSQFDFESAEFFADYLKSGKTSVVLGSSGVGKSTLVNFLIGRFEIRTQEIRDADGKGRHTTTSRQLYVSRFGGLIIDTPGMRELQLSDHTDGIGASFADVESLLGRCRFTDCSHITEPGCAVKAALEDGRLPAERWESFKKLEAEVRHGLRKQDKALAAEDRKRWKTLSQQVRDNGRRRRDRRDGQ